MLLVILFLNLSASYSFGNCSFHRRSNAVGIHNNFAVFVSCCSANSLNKRSFGTQKTFLIGIKNCNKRHFGNIKSLTKQVNANQNIKFTKSQISNNLHSLNSVNIVVHISNFDVKSLKISGQILCHLLCKSSNKHSFFAFNSNIDFGQ